MKKIAAFAIFMLYTSMAFTQQGLIWSTEVPNIWGSSLGGPIMIFDLSSNIIIGGDFYGSSDSRDIVVAKLTQDGTILWQSSFDGDSSLTDHIEAITTDFDGNVLITGNTQTKFVFGGDLLLSEVNAFVAKFSKDDGTELWRHSFPVEQWKEGATGHAIGCDIEGNCYVTGNRQPLLSKPETYFLTKFDPNGNIIWDIFNVDETIISTGRTLIVSGDSIIIRGYKSGVFPNNYYSLFTSIYGLNSNLLHHFEAQPSYYPFTVFDTPTGACRIGGGYYDKYAIAAFNNFGEQIWTYQETGSPTYISNLNNVNDIVIDGAGNTLATGYIFTDDNAYTDFMTVKIDPSGQLLWKTVSGSSRKGIALDIDPNGNAIVAGVFDHLQNMLLLKIDSMGNENGRLIVEKIFPNSVKVLDTESFLIAGVNQLNGFPIVQKYDIVLSNSERKLEHETIQSYPNPATSVLSIQIPRLNFNFQGVNVFDGLGRIIHTDFSYLNNVLILDVKALSTGIYHCLIFGQNHSYSTSFIIVQ